MIDELIVMLHWQWCLLQRQGEFKYFNQERNDILKVQKKCSLRNSPSSEVNWYKFAAAQPPGSKCGGGGTKGSGELPGPWKGPGCCWQCGEGTWTWTTWSNLVGSWTRATADCNSREDMTGELQMSNAKTWRGRENRAVIKHLIYLPAHAVVCLVCL